MVVPIESCVSAAKTEIKQQQNSFFNLFCCAPVEELAAVVKPPSWQQIWFPIPFGNDAVKLQYETFALRYTGKNP